MNEGSDNEPGKGSLVSVNIQDILGLSKPLAKLVDVVARGTGVLYRPRAILKEAKAKAEAKIYLAQAEGTKIEIVESSKIKVEKMKELAGLDIAIRAEARVKRQEFLRQKNIEQIAFKTETYLPEEVSEVSIDQDWIARFFNTAMDVSDVQMQEVWARLLAGEIEKPGSYSLRTMEVLKNMTKSDAEIFEKACRLVFDNLLIVV